MRAREYGKLYAGNTQIFISILQIIDIDGDFQGSAWRLLARPI
jgi:hypothetical protein